MLGLLVLEYPRTVSVPAIIDAVWGEQPPETVRNAIQVSVSRLRQLLRPLTADITRAGDGYAFEPGGVAVDVHRFQELVTAARSAFQAQRTSEGLDLLERVDALWQGEPLSGVEAPYADLARTRLTQSYRLSRSDAAESLISSGRADAALPIVSDLAVEAPYDERVLALLVTAQYRLGRTAEAVATWTGFQRRLADDLGLDPTPRTAALLEQVLNHRLDEPGPPEPPQREGTTEGRDGQLPTTGAAGPRPRSGPRSTNLMMDLPPLVGRDELIQSVVEALQAGSHRLVTLIGTGGVGKSSVALRVASRMLPGTADGVYVVRLANVARSDEVAGTVAESLRLQPAGGAEPAQVVAEYLSERSVLLVVDNLEHVIGAAAQLEGWLAASPNLQVLATSRLATRLEHELVIEVPPLDAGSSSPSTRQPPAVELFVHRADRSDPHLRWTEQDLATVGQICRRLDGLPLAIELAAARIRILRPPAMLERLTSPMTVAAGGSPLADPRQQTLRATVAWSYDLLSARQQRLFRHLAVFCSPFLLEAAEAVCEAELDDIAALLDHHLLRTVDTGDSRFAMLETIRAYAAELFEGSPEVMEIKNQHAAWAAQLARSGGPLLLNGEHEKFLTRYDAERADLDAALDWLDRSGRAGEALEMAANLAVFWDTRGQSAHGLPRLRSALAAAPDADQLLRARALFSIGRMELQLGRAVRASDVLAQALSVFTAAADARAITLCLSHLGECAARSDRRRAVGLCREAVAVARTSGDAWTIAVGLNNLASQLLADPEPGAEVRELLEECVAIRRRLGEKRTLAISLGNLGEQLIADEEFDRAEAVLDEALGYALELGFEAIIGDVRCNLAALARQRGDLDHAETLLQDAMTRAERLGDVELLKACRNELERIHGTRTSTRR